MPVAAELTRGTVEELSFSMPPTAWRGLFAALADGDEGALGALYDLAAPALYGLALAATRSRDAAEDVVAESFLRVAEQGPALRRVRDPRAWLLTVARRLCVDLGRRGSRRRTEPLEAADCVAAPLEDPGRAVDARRASRLIDRLPPGQREVVYLRLAAGCSFAEIGRVVRVPTFTAASRYRLAIRRLRRLLENP